MTAESLSQIETAWTLVWRAQGRGKAAQRALETLALRYQKALRRYLAGRVNDPHLADEVLQEFMVQLLTGKLSGVDRQQGRFRQYVKGVLHHLLARQYRRRQRGGPRQRIAEADLADGRAADPSDADYDAAWRDELLELSWLRLRDFQDGRPDNLYHTVLSLRTQFPEASIEELAEKLAAATGRDVNATSFRKILERARRKLAELMLEGLRELVAEPTPERLEEELRSLGLWEICRAYHLRVEG